jgi:hypothetical protein
MIAFLRGRLLVKSPNRAIIECGGVGYDATISVATFTALPPEGAEARLHIYTHVREDQIALFGFAEPDEKRLFEKLLTISGIGPKLAITVLSGIDTDRLVTAIRGGDHATLTRIRGGRGRGAYLALRPGGRRCAVRDGQPRLPAARGAEGGRDRAGQEPRRRAGLRGAVPRGHGGGAVAVWRHLPGLTGRNRSITLA